MKKIKTGGIKQKIFSLVITTIVLMVASYTAVLIYQSHSLTELVRNTNESQKQSIASISDQTMSAILNSNLAQSTQMEAYIAGDVFGDAVRVVNIVADYTGKLFADPENYPLRETSSPDKDKDGQISVQVLAEAGIDLNDPEISEKLGLIGNLSFHMFVCSEDAAVGEAGGYGAGESCGTL